LKAALSLKDRKARYAAPIGPAGVTITTVVLLLCDKCAIKNYIPLAYEVRRIKKFTNKKERETPCVKIAVSKVLDLDSGTLT
jgi:hypothetical protein